VSHSVPWFCPCPRGLFESRASERELIALVLTKMDGDKLIGSGGY
jgi:hypothetical protein